MGYGARSHHSEETHLKDFMASAEPKQASALKMADVRFAELSSDTSVNPQVASPTRDLVDKSNSFGTQVRHTHIYT